MASVQCYKPSEQSCNQGHHSSSLGQKVSEVASWAFKSSSETKNHATHSTTGYTQTQCYGKTQTDCTDQGMAKTQTNHCYSQTQIHNSNQGMSHGHGHGLTHTHSVDQNKVHGCGQTQTTCTDQNKAHGHCQTETQTHATNGMATCKGRSKKRGEQKKRGLFQRIKEGIAGDSSSSESDSDDDNSGKRKN